MIVSVGYVEQKQTSRFVYILDLVTPRVRAGFLLVAIGIAAVGLGFVEILAPDHFDAMGGGYQEMFSGIH